MILRSSGMITKVRACMHSYIIPLNLAIDKFSVHDNGMFDNEYILPAFMTTSRSWAETTPSLTRRQHSLSRAYWGKFSCCFLFVQSTRKLYTRKSVSVECSLHLHPVEDKAGHLPWEADRSLTNLGHKGASTRADLQLCKTELCGHCTQWQIKCKFFVRYKEAKEYRNWNVQKPRCWSMVQAPTRPWVCGTEGCTGAPRWTGLCAPWSRRSCSELCSAKISTVDNGKQWIESHRCRRWRCPRWSRCPPACPPRPTPSSWGRAPPARTPARTSPQWHTLPSLPSH